MSAHINMPQPDARAELAGALARMLEAHDALVCNVNSDTLRRYEEAVTAARIAHRALNEAADERVQKGRRP